MGSQNRALQESLCSPYYRVSRPAPEMYVVVTHDMYDKYTPISQLHTSRLLLFQGVLASSLSIYRLSLNLTFIQPNKKTVPLPFSCTANTLNWEPLVSAPISISEYGWNDIILHSSWSNILKFSSVMHCQDSGILHTNYFFWARLDLRGTEIGPYYWV